MTMEAINTNLFTSTLFEKMKRILPAIDSLEFYEFEYALTNLQPECGWSSVVPAPMQEIEARVGNRKFYDGIQTKKKVGEKIALDETILHLTQMLFAGLVTGVYSEEWVDGLFYFDIRAFLFFHRTEYFSDAVLEHFGGKAYRSFTVQQKKLLDQHEIGYREFKEANADVDQAFVDIVVKLVEVRGVPILLTLAGPTAAGKTEIMDRLYRTFGALGKRITTIEMDNFLLDREIRGEQAIGKNTTHYEIFKKSLADILQGKRVVIPSYDFINATSSHDIHGELKPGRSGMEIEPADIVFIEGNFPFQLQEISDLIGIKVVYLTDDPVRLKRKWKRDIDYRKKYDPNFFINRFFKTQFLRAEDCYLLQMKNCDIVVETTTARVWVTPKIIELIESK